MLLTLSDSVIRLLMDSGWSPDRNVNIEPLIQELLGCGFRPNHFACDFLASLYGIEITPPWNPDGVYHPDYVNFDPRYDHEYDRISAWIPALAPKSIMPIGKGFSRRSSLVICNEGAMYGISDIGVSLIGEDISSAMDTLLLATQKPSLIFDIRDLHS